MSQQGLSGQGPSGRRIPQATLEAQRTASDPHHSAWVYANAGSGKTTVLTRRVMRLLLAGAAPARILCLTFTKAAAANMQNRIFRELGRWARLPDAALAAEIAGLEGAAPGRDGLARARRLFAAAVETPGGLKILTIHAFCERVLHLFPFEANVPAQFSVLDDRAAADLLAAAREAVLVAANTAPESRLGLAFARIVEATSEDGFDTLLRELTDLRGELRPLLAAGEAAARARLWQALGLDPGERVADVEARMLEEGLPRSEWPAIAAALRDLGGATLTERADAFDRAAAAPAGEALEAYLSVFLTAKHEPRKTLLTKPAVAAFPDLALRMEAERERLADLIPRRKAAVAAERSAALLVLAEALLGRYEAGKAARAALDFDDLVGRTRTLLRRAGADWVLYKLDQGIDHILVDEAQDTSPHQWEIVDTLAREFTAGAGARIIRRTVFAVGDEKQSIYSFQGAAPDAFDAMRRHFARLAAEAGEPFAMVPLSHSFRSTRDVLEAVDTVFKVPENRRGLSADDAEPFHPTVRGEEPGRVEVWPVERPDALPPTEPWDAPFDVTPAGSPVVRLARRIAREVRRLTQGEEATARAGEVMVLVRTRGPVFDAVIRELKQAGVPVAGADRLVLTRHIAVMDLLALARFVLMPEDDLTLAALLKSPLLGLDDDDLMRLAPGRPGSLWAALREAGRSEPRYRLACDRLNRWIDQAAFRPPFAFFADILAGDGGRRAFYARLGLEAADALDEFLAAAADYEAKATPSLQGFVEWLCAAEAEVKRDMDVARDEVRVMTVHGAKGLEARIVVLADTCGAPNGRFDPKLYLVDDPQAPAGPPLLVWSGKSDDDPPLVAAERRRRREAAEGEYRRLLYVAMTRAEERLIVAGFEGKPARPAGNWYDMIAGSLQAAGAVAEPMPDGAGERLVWERTPRIPAQTLGAETAGSVELLPGWVRQGAPPPAPRPEPLRPSEAVAGEGSRRGGPEAMARAAERGRLIHRLLQSLPGIAAPEREAAALRFLAMADGGGAADHPALVAEVLALLAHPAIAPVFAEGGRAEVPIVGHIAAPDGTPRFVDGRIDRLWVGPDAVLLVDFKTMRDPPATLDAVPASAIGQLAVYRALLRQLYPGRAVRAAIVWTAGPSLMALPEEMLETALTRL